MGTALGYVSAYSLYHLEIDRDKCVSCGACVYQCPFGAITDKSFIIDAINMLKNKENKVYAVVAPQFQASSGMLKSVR